MESKSVLKRKAVQKGERLVIKPCGCGSEKFKISVNDGNYATYNVWVRCLECGDVGPSKKTIEDCIKAWDEQAL